MGGKRSIRITHMDVNIFEALLRYKKAHRGNMPTFRQLKENSIAKSICSVSHSLEKLETAGYIKRIGRSEYYVVGDGYYAPDIFCNYPKIGDKI